MKSVVCVLTVEDLVQRQIVARTAGALMISITSGRVRVGGCLLPALTACFAWLWVPVAVGMASPLGAQIGAGALAGDVIDQAGAALPRAIVTVVEVGTNQSRTVVTGEDGGYLVQGLGPGAYQVRVELSGFRPLARDGIRIATGETVRLDLELAVGSTEAITVTGDAPLLRSETSALGQVIDNRHISDLPLNGRSFITLAAWRRAWRCRLDRRCRASMAVDHGPTNICSTAFPYCSPSRGRSRFFRTSTRFRNSRSRPTARQRNSDVSTAAWST